MNPSEVNQKLSTQRMPIRQCNVGNPSFSKGIVGDHWRFLLARMSLRRSRCLCRAATVTATATVTVTATVMATATATVIASAAVIATVIAVVEFGRGVGVVALGVRLGWPVVRRKSLRL